MQKNKMGTFAALALGALVAFGQPTFAEQGRDNTRGRENRQAQRQQGRRNPQQKLQRLAKKLNLTQEQQSRIRPILQDAAQRVQSVRKDNNLPRERKREQVKDIQADAFARINSILTSEQRRKLAELRQRAQERRAQRGERREGRQRRVR